jgi:Holliday junction resolvase RusA-like endonuclease
MTGKALLNFTIPNDPKDYRIPGLNEIIAANRTNRFGGAKQKRDAQAHVVKYIPEYKVSKYPVLVDIVWYEKDNRRDVDNVNAGVKFLLDALVNEGVLEDDSRKYVRAVRHDVLTDKNNPRIEVTILSLN